jgi:Kef-type K+ transport system membrane component KefB
MIFWGRYMEIHHFFLQILTILLIARVLGEVVVRFGIPAVIGELFAGILIGPSILHLIAPSEMLKPLAEVGIILLLFEVGLETDIGRLAKTGSRPFIVAVGGVVLPFLLGFLVSNQLFHLNFLTSLFVGSTLTATSIGITMRVLTDLKKQGSDEAQIVLGAAVLDDIIGIIILSILYEFSQGGGVDLFHVGEIFFSITLFLVLAPIAAKCLSGLVQHQEKKSEIPGLLPTTMISLILFFAWLAYQVGAPQLLGGFAVGVAFSRHFSLPFGPFFSTPLQPFSAKVEAQMKPIIHLFTPIFFVMIGVSLNFHEVNWGSSFVWLLSFALLVVAVLGKFCSGFLLFKENRWIKWAVGIAMVPRGEVGLIFAEVGLDSKIFSNDLYAVMILVISVTTIFTPFVMQLFYTYKEKNRTEQALPELME